MKKAAVLMTLILAGISTARAEEGKGKATYDAKCASCHGKDGKGNAALSKIFKVEPSALDLTAKSVQDKKDSDLNGLTAKGKGKMPAFAGKLGDKEIAGVTGYVRTLAKPKPASPAKTEPEKMESTPAVPAK